MSTQPNTYITPEQYLEIDRAAERKSEYLDGEMFAMAGATGAHDDLVWGAMAQLSAQLKDGRCRGHTSDMRVLVSSTGLYTYPDLTVVCGERKYLDDRRDTLLNPTLIVEVLSRSTEGYDRGRKFSHYRSIESLKEYLLIASDRVQAELFRKQPDRNWLLIAASGSEVLQLESINCTLSLATLYEGVELAAS